MQPVMEPAADAVPRAVRADDASRFGIDVVTRLRRIVQSRKDDRQRAVTTSIEVVPVVLIELANITETGRLGRFHDVDDPTPVEFGRRSSVECQYAGVPAAECGDEERLTGNRRELQFPDVEVRPLRERTPPGNRRTQRPRT